MAIFHLTLPLKVRRKAIYKAAHNDAGIENKDHGPKSSETETHNLNVGVEEIVAQTLGAKHAD